MKKRIWEKAALAAMLGSCLMAGNVFAGEWREDQRGWWYQNDDGSYPTDSWQWIDGNKDGNAECYYFNEMGYCVLNGVTPDGYTVDGTGAWTVNGTVQTQPATTLSQVQSAEQGGSGGSVRYLELSRDKQYEINAFLSNLAEYSGEACYIDISAPDVDWIVDFCYHYTKIYTGYDMKVKNVFNKKRGWESSYYVCPLEQLNKVADRFFGITFTADQVRNGYKDGEYSFFQGDDLYFVAADGEAYTRFAVANAMYLDPYGDQVVDFDIYKMDADLYWSAEGDAKEPYYPLSSAEAAQKAGLSKVAKGRAVVRSVRYQSRDTYQIKMYHVEGQ